MRNPVNEIAEDAACAGEGGILGKRSLVRNLTFGFRAEMIFGLSQLMISHVRFVLAGSKRKFDYIFNTREGNIHNKKQTKKRAMMIGKDRA